MVMERASFVLVVVNSTVGLVNLGLGTQQILEGSTEEGWRSIALAEFNLLVATFLLWSVRSRSKEFDGDIFLP
jgi:hypothetical protein